jgi:hypothetical protein
VHVPLVLGWLAHACRPDGRYAANRVCSIYYDTPGLTLLDEKRNSDYLKRKVRLRWYAAVAGAPAPAASPAFIEVKLRVGSFRHKLREPVPQDGTELARLSLEHPHLLEMPARLRPHGLPLPPGLVPVMRVDYIRHRFVDRATGERISLDCAISAPATAPRVLPAVPGARLPVAVLEVKGTSGELPPALRGLASRWVRQGAFSKYAACVEKLTRR